MRPRAGSGAFVMRLLALLACLACAWPADTSAGPKSVKPLATRGGPFDFGINLDPPPNDRCENAIVIPCGNIDLSGHTGLAANDYSPTDSLCTGFLAEGADVVYRIDATAGDSLWLNYNTVFDGSVYIVGDCANVSATCVVGRDSVNTAGTERIRHKFTSTGTYYLILDAFGVGGGGAWTAAGQFLCGSIPLPPNDVCANAISLLCGPFSVSGSTELALDDYHFASAGTSCTGQLANGRDVVYRLNVTSGDSLWANYWTSTDGSIYILSACDNSPAACVYGVDAVGPGVTEQLRYKFAFSGQYYLVIDSRDANSFGGFNVMGGLECGLGVPSNDQCADAIPIFCGDIALSGSTQRAVNHYTFPSEFVSCTDFLADGRDVVYQVNAAEGDSIALTYESTSDASIYVVTNCSDVVNTCVAGVDDNVEGEPEFLRFRFPSTGIYYIILDSYALDSWGDWTAIGQRFCGLAGVGDRLDPGGLDFSGAFPNPFRATTVLEYTMPAAGHATLKIHDLQGRVMRRLLDGDRPAGQHRTVWDGRDDQGVAVGPGVYFAQLESDGRIAQRRLIFVR
jgi:hypothetical protein